MQGQPRRDEEEPTHHLTLDAGGTRRTRVEPEECSGRSRGELVAALAEPPGFVLCSSSLSIRFVYFDVGGTLLDPTPSVGRVYAEAGAPLGLLASASDIEAAFRRQWSAHIAALGRAALTLAKTEEENFDWWRQLVFRVLEDVGFAGDREAVFRACWAAFERPSAWHVYEDARPTLEAFASRGLRRGVLSNWDQRLPSLLEMLDLRRYFDPLVVSCFEGVEKPDVRFYERACARVGLPPESILYVGDKPELDLAPARSIGMRAYLIDRRHRLAGPHRLSSLHELLALADGPRADPKTPSQAP